MNRMLIDLTEEQKMQLLPMFHAVRESNAKDIACAVFAQVFQDGMHVKLVTGDKVDNIRTAAGCVDDSDEYSNSARGAYERGIERDFIKGSDK